MNVPAKVTFPNLFFVFCFWYCPFYEGRNFNLDKIAPTQAHSDALKAWLGSAGRQEGIEIANDTTFG